MKKSCALALHSLAPLRMSAVPHGMSWEAADRQAWNRLCVKALFLTPAKPGPQQYRPEAAPQPKNTDPKLPPQRFQTWSKLFQIILESFLDHSWTILGHVRTVGLTTFWPDLCVNAPSRQKGSSQAKPINARGPALDAASERASERCPGHHLEGEPGLRRCTSDQELIHK